MTRLIVALCIAGAAASAQASDCGGKEQLCAVDPASSGEAIAARSPNALKTPSVEVGFAPEGRAGALVLKVVRSAQSSIRVAGYSFTSPAVTRALIEARRRGIDVAVLVDYRRNLVESHTNASRQALDQLVNAGIPTRTVSAYPLHHDKYIVVDSRHVETGSFNYTTAAARQNSENVLVLWNNPAVAVQYVAHWQSRWDQGEPYRIGSSREGGGNGNGEE